MKRVTLLLALLLSGLVLAQIPLKPRFNPFNPLALPTEIKETDLIGPYGSVFRIYWDGWESTLVLRMGGTGYLEVDGKRYNVRFAFPRNPQDIVPGASAGPGYTGKNTNLGHRIVIFVDFPNTPNNSADDQRFDGYVFTQTIRTRQKIAAAGITWWNGIPFGFYMTFLYDVIG